VYLTLGPMEILLWGSRSTFDLQMTDEELHRLYQTQLLCCFVGR
jgi:hypothetical protein